MKAISLHQPWASLIAVGIKTIETRSWAPPKALIGQRIAIHAAKKTISIQDIPEIWQPLVGMYKNFGSTSNSSRSSSRHRRTPVRP